MRSSEPIIVIGNLGWRNPEDCNETQFRAYGPGGRWLRRPNGSGDALENALVAAGATEGDRLIVVALSRYTPQAALDRIPAAIADEVDKAIRDVTRND